jgi:hypothetical protein
MLAASKSLMVCTAEPVHGGPRARAFDRALARLALAAALSASLGCAGCVASNPATPAASPGVAANEPSASRKAVARSSASNVRSAPPESSSTSAPSSEACGPFECRWFDSGADALGVVLAEAPVALGVGEAHALAGTEHLSSTVRRFSDELLPSLEGHASHLVVELLNPDPRCAVATREVRRAQRPVTMPQSKQNQSDYVELGTHARALGIEPFVLSPTCDEFRAIAAAGSGAIDAMLTTIGRVTSRMLRGALAKNQAAGRTAIVIGYGGALHNDIAPSEEKVAWSYGPDLVSFTGERYVELDLIVREFIKDTAAWRALPWYAHFDPARDESRWLLMRTRAHRYALFFPKEQRPPARD